MAEEKPRYEHGCFLLGCHFLGTYGEYDLYVHWEWKGEKTVIARWGDAPHEYTSGLPAVGTIEPLKEALKRAIDRNIVPKNVAYPLQVRRAFRDDLKNMDAFVEFVFQEAAGLLNKALTEELTGSLTRLIKNIWCRYYQEGIVDVRVEEMPEFRVFGEGSTLCFEWKEPEYGVGRFCGVTLENPHFGGR